MHFVMIPDKYKPLLLRCITGTILAILFWGTYYWAPVWGMTLLLASCLGIMLFYEWRTIATVIGSQAWILGLLYPIFPFFVLMFFNHVPLYRPLLTLIFSCIPAFDTGSYFIGTLIGKYKIAPSISPNKTVEGAVGGYLFCSITFFLMCYPLASIVESALYSIPLCLVAFTGDLFASWLKRRTNIKHSGHILPGHGGMLDRFDGIMAATIFVYLMRNKFVLLIA